MRWTHPIKKRTHRQEQAQARRAQILKAALELFAHQGFSATSTKQLAHAVGITEGLLYHYFPSKVAIFAEIMQRPYEVGSTMVSHLVETEDRSVKVVIPQVSMELLSLFRQESSLIGLVIGESQFSEEIRQTLLKMFQTFRSPIVAYLKRHVTTGEVRATTDISTMVDTLIGSIHFFFLTHRSLSDREWQEASQHFLRTWFDIWYAGIAGDSSRERE